MSKTTSPLWSELDFDSQASYQLEIAESYTGISIRLPFLVWKGVTEGPTIFISGAVHGDEINGSGCIRELITQAPFELQSGTLVLVPVVNIQGFERQTRYMPDRRDLNRYFPGARTGSLTSRLADVFFSEIVNHCDFGIDLHSASVRRTNFPHIRADMKNRDCAFLAEAFGTEIIINGSGPEGSLRREATEHSCPTIVLEAGEVWKVETSYVETAHRGISNILKKLKMIDGELFLAEYQLISDSSKWLRAQSGGFLQFHVSPGEPITKGQKISTNTDLLGRETGSIISPYNGIVIGMTTIPTVAPGDPVVHIVLSSKSEKEELEAYVDNVDEQSLENRTRDDMATNIHITEDKEDLYG